MMRYTYILDGNSWKLIESSGYAHYIQTNVFVGTISGKITHQTVTNERSNNTCKDPKYAVESHLTYRGVYPNYRTVNRLGRIKLKGISSTMSFEPVFYELPGYIV